jgi:hypothetical protein
VPRYQSKLLKKYPMQPLKKLQLRRPIQQMMTMMNPPTTKSPRWIMVVGEIMAVGAVVGAVEDEVLAVEGESLLDEEMLAAVSVRVAGAGLPPVVGDEAAAEVEATRNTMLLMTRPLVGLTKVVEAMRLVNLEVVGGIRKTSPARTKLVQPRRSDWFVTASSPPSYYTIHRLYCDYMRRK